MDRIQVHEPHGRFSLRLKPPRVTQASASPIVAELLRLHINRCAEIDGNTIARLGPDEWLVLCPEVDTNHVGQKLNGGLAGTSSSLTDISHRNVGIAVAGRNARGVLNGGCALDLSDNEFPPGSATRTLLGKAEIVLLRDGDAPVYRVECWRSFAPYVHAFLLDAARDYLTS